MADYRNRVGKSSFKRQTGAVLAPGPGTGDGGGDDDDDSGGGGGGGGDIGGGSPSPGPRNPRPTPGNGSGSGGSDGDDGGDDDSSNDSEDSTDESEPDISVTEINVNGSEPLMIDDQIEVEVVAKNEGDAEGSRSYDVFLEAQNLGTVNLGAIGPGETESDSTTVQIPDTGNVQIIVGTKTKSINASSRGPSKGYDITVDSLSVAPQDPEVGDNIAIVTEISNKGDFQQTRTFEVKVNGDVMESRSVELRGGESETISIEVQAQTEGSMVIEAGNSSKEISVSPSNNKVEAELTNFRTNNPNPVVGSTVTVMADVDNTTENRGRVNIPITVNGQEVDVTSVTLQPNGSATVEATVSVPNQNSFTISMMGEEMNLETQGQDGENAPVDSGGETEDIIAMARNFAEDRPLAAAGVAATTLMMVTGR